MTDPRYEFLKNTASGPAWERIGLRRRSGVVAPLFSIYSSESLGIGDLADLKFLADWCVACGISIIQLLPINDVGFNFRPYDAESTFALDPMYLSPNGLAEAASSSFAPRIQTIRNDFPTGQVRIAYGIKQAKLDLFYDIYKAPHHVKHPFSLIALVEDNLSLMILPDKMF